jgi:hypothetical protein
LNRVHWLFKPALYRRVHEPNLVDGARIELALHGCRPWVIPLYEPPKGEPMQAPSRAQLARAQQPGFGCGALKSRVSQCKRRAARAIGEGAAARFWLWSPQIKWGEMRESKSRNWSHNPAPQPFGQSRRKIWSWRGDSNAAHGLTRPALFPLSYTSTNPGDGGENCTPDNLLCRQRPCCLGDAVSKNHRSFGLRPQDFACGPSALPLRGFTSRVTRSPLTPANMLNLERSTGIAPVFPDWRSGVLLLYELRLERAVRVELT